MARIGRNARRRSERGAAATSSSSSGEEEVSAEVQWASAATLASYLTLIWQAVCLLYVDGITPEAPILRRRLKELGAEWATSLRYDSLRWLCEGAGLVVQDLKSGHRKVKLGMTSGDSFVVEMPEGDRPAELLSAEECDRSKYQDQWNAVVTRLQKEEDLCKHKLTCNYALARLLQMWPDSGVSGLRLGIIHGLIPQLLSQRILGHRSDGTTNILVLFKDSDEQQQLLKFGTPGEGRVSTWADLRRLLRQLLARDTQRKGVQLQVLKKWFPQYCNVDLYQEVFDYLKLAELLGDARLADIVETRKVGTMVKAFAVPQQAAAALPEVQWAGAQRLQRVVVKNTFLQYSAEDMAEEDSDNLSGFLRRRRARSASPGM